MNKQWAREIVAALWMVLAVVFWAGGTEPVWIVGAMLASLITGNSALIIAQSNKD